MAHQSFIIPTPTSKDLERFWKLVDKNGPTQAHCPELGPCWAYTGNRFRNGYGTFWLQKRETTMHRMSLTIHLGHSPDPDLVILHKCDNPICCNPYHLQEGTILDNARDAQQKGRTAQGDKNGSRKHPEAVPRGTRHYEAKLTEEIVLRARKEYAEGNLSVKELVYRYNVDIAPQVMHEAICGKTWKHLPGAVAHSGGKKHRNKRGLHVLTVSMFNY